MSAHAPFNPAPVTTPHSERLDRIRTRERELITERAYAAHDRTCSRGPRCEHRERHTLRDYVLREQGERMAEIDAQISDLYVARALVQGMR